MKIKVANTAFVSFYKSNLRQQHENEHTMASIGLVLKVVKVYQQAKL